MLSLGRQVEELTMIRCSLLPGEHLTFLDSFPNSIRNKDETQMEYTANEAVEWERLLSAGSILSDDPNPFDAVRSPARFRVTVDGASVSFEVNCQGYDGECKSVNECISINGDNLTRAVHEEWRDRIRESLEKIEYESGGEYPLYHLISIYLLPLLHQTTSSQNEAISSQAPPPSEKIHDHHVLFTSHHLVSLTKRRNLQNWSSEFRVSGFAKVGYPGVIYAQGSKEDLEEFVRNVKAMQWLALKVRFLEPLLEADQTEIGGEYKGWKELEKIGQVVEEMRRLGRGKYIVEMGIGSGTR